MDRNFTRALPLVLKHEGGYVDHPKDPGGATNKGVTLATFRKFVKADGSKADLRKITDDQVATVYYRGYWSAVQGPALPSGVDYAVFDFAVNSGPKRAAQFLQKVVGVSQDGRVGPLTIEAAKAMSASEIVNRLCDDRLAWMQRIKHRTTGARLWDTFGKGWSRRVADVRSSALSMVGNPADVEKVPVPVDKPVVPDQVETEVKKKTGFWQKIFGGVLGGGAPLAWLAGVDWQTILAAGGVGIAFFIAIILLRRQIISAVSDIRKAVEQ